ncbi:MAG: hypothetical protein JW801_09635 [Bacteroidales bacterium]|nr:hypothetical protein [Bacteroidales bacterium]
MKRRTFIRNTSAAGVLTLITPKGIFQLYHPAGSYAPAKLADGFQAMPDSARPHAIWEFMNGNVTKAGITRDLEAAKRAGVAGLMNTDVGTGAIKGPVNYNSPEFWELKNHAISECNRLGLYFGMTNCPGWSNTAGPWVTPEYSMLEVTWSESPVKGGKQVDMTLPEPLSREDFYRDTYVLAYPAMEGESSLEDLLKVITSTGGLVSMGKLVGIYPEGEEVRVSGNGPASLQFEFKEPYEARYLSFMASVSDTGENPGRQRRGFREGIILEASDDGLQFKEITSISTEPPWWRLRPNGESFITVDFPAVKAKYFRLSSSDSYRYSLVRFSGAARITGWKGKANFSTGGDEAARTKDIPAGSVIDPDTVINLTGQMDSEGRLHWKAPKGNWMILRIGYTTTASRNNGAPEGGLGLEIDKYSKEALDMHFNIMMKKVLSTMTPLAEKNKVYLEIDSWEVDVQNWTPKFPEEFKRSAGYDLVRYLLAMTGRVVGSADISDRFLWDVRRIQADLIADNYYAHFTELCKEHGITSYNEPYPPGPFEELQIGSRVDVSMGEFWNGLCTWLPFNILFRRTIKLAASVSHAYGRKIVGAESFTAEAPSGKWQNYPFSLKALGDRFFSEGLTRMVFHRFAHQPHPDSNVAPGMTMAYWGIHFERTNTWWESGKKWLDYVSRCQYMLQQGLFVADFAYFTGEGAPKEVHLFSEELRPEPPAGYDYDMVNREVILNRMQVKDGRIVLPDGMSYRMLVLQDQETITLELIKKIRELVHQGMILYGSKPVRTPGLGTRSGDEKTMLEITGELWGDMDGTTNTEHEVEKGKVFWGEPLGEVLKKLDTAPDFESTSLSGDAPVRYIHRTIEGSEAYFICNDRRKYEELVCTFRVGDRQPEFWDPDSGKITPAGVYDIFEGRIRVPVQLNPCGSVFVVFRAPISGHRVKVITKGNEMVLGTTPFKEVKQIKYDNVTDNFSISVWVKPEIDIMVMENRMMRTMPDMQWTDYYAIYPPSGRELYGEDHETCGLAVGRNGVAVWHRHGRWPYMRMIVKSPLEGWTHVVLVYDNGVPSVYLNGQVAKGELIENEGKVKMVHPGIGKAFLEDGASYYNGDMMEPELFTEVLTGSRIKGLFEVGSGAEKLNDVPFIVQAGGNEAPEILFWENGTFNLEDSRGQTKSVEVNGITPAEKLKGPWEVKFPPDLGAPEKIALPELISLHKHELAGVKYFSGTATYNKEFEVTDEMMSGGKRLFLDLGRVEVIAEVSVNGKNLGALWSRPYQVEITGVVKKGNNVLSVKVVNLWPNRLIGDEQLPPEYEYEGDATHGDSVARSGFSNRGESILKMPEWYLKGEPRPKGQRIAFTVWKHYYKNDPLLESGLIGPVVLKTAVRSQI